MSECRFCEGKKVAPECFGEGIHTMKTNLLILFGYGGEDEGPDGIHLVDSKYLAFDNSSGEYAEMMVKINYCPFCGKRVEPKEG